MNTVAQTGISIARLPIFDQKRRLWGYELFGVGGEAVSGIQGEETAALTVASGAYIALQQIVSSGKKIMVNFSEKNILRELPYALPPVLAAIKVSEQMCTRQAVSDSLGRLKGDGYMIAIEGFNGNPQCESVYQLADIICLDTFSRKKTDLAEMMEAIRPYNTRKLASNVENPERFTLCQELGFNLFHGPFFKSPQPLKIRKLSSGQVSRFKLLKVIEQEEPDYAELAKAIQADVAISFRLLAYLNSAAFGLRQKINTIQQAIPLLGWRKMRSWLRVVLLTDMSQSGEASELFTLSAQRGKFLELVARDNDFWGFDPDTLMLLGMFSLLDAMLGMPMKEVVDYMPLESKFKAALCREPNNEYQPLLQLAISVEEARWGDAEQLCRHLNLDPAKIRTSFQAAVNWAALLGTVTV